MLRGNLAAWTALLAAAAPACSPGRGQTGDLCVVLVSIDTLRADHVGCYGHAAAATPHIDALAARGTRFDTCTSSCPMTLPSHSTMMTGTYPFVHGARTNGTFVLADENVTLAEALRDAGYATRAEISAAVLDADFGLDQGFDEYGDSFIDEQIAAWDVRDDARRLFDTERPAQAVTESALAYLETRRRLEQPFFLFLHYFDPHLPHAAPEPFSSRYEDGYLAEIAYTDAQLGRVIDILREPDFEQRTLLVVTSDHGEGRFDHDEFTHGTFLYDTTLHVPLVMAGAHIRPGQAVAAQVGLVDLAPTVLALVGAPPLRDVQGTSLVPLLENPGADLGLCTYSETVEPRVTLDYSHLRSLRGRGWKYIHAPRPELYDVLGDPQELLDRARGEPRRVTDMHADLREVVSASPPLLGRGSPHELEAEDIERLAALGYASADVRVEEDDPHTWTDEAAHLEPSGPNPMDRKRDIFILSTALATLRDGEYEQGIESWSQFLALNPEYAPGHSMLAQCYASLGRRAEAIAPLTRALELDPTRCDDYQILGSMLAESGEQLRARVQFERALTCDPGHALAAFNLGKLSLLLGDPARALEALDATLLLTPTHAKAHSLRALALRGLGRKDEAVTACYRAVELEPPNPGFRTELASLLQEVGRLDEALAVYEDALRIIPRNASIRAAAARFWMDRGDGARALELLDTGLRQQPQSVALSTLRVRVLATDANPAVRNGERALQLAQRLLQEGHGEDPRVLSAAATAAAEQGGFEQAIELAERALVAAQGSDAEGLTERIRAELAGYRAKQPARAR